MSGGCTGGPGAPFLLGVDGGGSRCRAALADAQGRVLARAEGGPANIASDIEGALASILHAAGQAMAGRCGPGQAVAVLGLAGANLPEAAARAAARLPFARTRIVTDAAIAVTGALGDDDGIVAIAGTGSVFSGRRGGQERGVGGWGLVLGDEGSGAWIGRSLCARALRALDGFVPMTPLLRRILDEVGGSEGGAGVVAFAQAARPADFAALVPQALEAAAAGDGAADAVLAAAAADTFAAVDVLQAALPGAAPLPVVFLGGLGPVHARRAPGRWPVRPPRGDALDGALWQARALAEATAG